MSVLLKDITDLYSLPIRKTYVSMMHFYMWQYYSTYFSSAFNTIQPHIFARKFLDTNVSWIFGYLTSRCHYVSHEGIRSPTVHINTGALKAQFWHLSCKCLLIGHRNLDINYNMGDTLLDTFVKEKE